MSESLAPPLRVATYNVRGCVGMDRRRSESRIAEVIASLSADIVALQELDLSRRRSGGVDQAGLIAEQLGWERFFSPAVRKAEEQYGDAIISRFPLRLRQAQELPSVSSILCREPRAAMWAEADTPAGTVQIINTHLGLGRRERLMQMQLLIGPEWLGRMAPTDPLILMGDLNFLPGSSPYRLLVQHLHDARTFFPRPPGLRTFPTTFPVAAVDHIFVNDKLRAEKLLVARSPLARIASDHYPVVADLRWR
jgi:endonuclease/exonuclease/phosphatase family metal-dependent hydrolase